MSRAFSSLPPIRNAVTGAASACVAVLLLITGSVPAVAANVTYVLDAFWTLSAKNQPTGGVTTITNARIQVLPSEGVCVSVDISQERNRGSEGISQEQGCTPRPRLTVASDLSTATLHPIDVPLYRLIRNCPPETPQDCSFTEEFSRTVSVSASWTATSPLERVCTGTYLADVREAAAPSGVIGDLVLPSGTPNVGTFGSIMRQTRTRC